MKIAMILSFLFSISAFAKVPSLFVKDGQTFLDVETLIDDGEDIQSVYGFEDFCYQGEVNAVTTKIRQWNKAGSFFSGDGGGHALSKVTLLRGISTYEIALKFEDEVVPGEFTTVKVKPCNVR